MARPLGGGRVGFAAGAPVRHFRCFAVAGLRLISAAGTPRPELALCPDGASLRSLVVDGGWGRARNHPASLHVGWTSGAAAPRSRSDQEPTKARSSGACGLSVAIAKRERNARRSRAHSTPDRRGRGSLAPRSPLDTPPSQASPLPRCPAPTRREFGARCACRRNKAQARIHDATRAPRGHARRDARSTAVDGPSHSPEGTPCPERPTTRTARRNRRATSGLRQSYVRKTVAVGPCSMGSAESP